MKNYVTLIYLIVTLSITQLFVLVFFLQNKISKAQTSTVTFSQPEPENTGAISDVYFPSSITFAGEEVPLHRIDVQEAFKKELIVNTYLHSHTIRTLKNAPRMFAIIEPILKKAGIPDDFKYLAVIESNLNPRAVSPAGAVGLWQLLEGTARDLGLEVNKEVDERYHIEKSTEAATQYLKKAYERFGTWTVAAAAYNAGKSMLAKQIEIQQENNYYNLLLGEETERYIFRILALKQILTHPELYNFYVRSVNPIEKTKKVKVKGPVPSWTEFAKKHGISYKTLKRFNPWLRRTELHNSHQKTYEILIPAHPEAYR